MKSRYILYIDRIIYLLLLYFLVEVVIYRLSPFKLDYAKEFVIDYMDKYMPADDFIIDRSSLECNLYIHQGGIKRTECTIKTVCEKDLEFDVFEISGWFHPYFETDYLLSPVQKLFYVCPSSVRIMNAIR